MHPSVSARAAVVGDHIELRLQSHASAAMDTVSWPAGGVDGLAIHTPEGLPLLPDETTFMPTLDGGRVVVRVPAGLFPPARLSLSGELVGRNLDGSVFERLPLPAHADVSP